MSHALWLSVLSDPGLSDVDMKNVFLSITENRDTGRIDYIILLFIDTENDSDVLSLCFEALLQDWDIDVHLFCIAAISSLLSRGIYFILL